MNYHDRQNTHNKIDHIFKDLLPAQGMPERLEQIALSHRMLEAMQDGGIALCDAGTGIGKTYAYLVAATVFHSLHPAQPILISTSSIALQKAVRDEYLPLLSAVLTEDGMITEEGYVFCQENGQPYEPRTYQDLFKRCVRQAGIRDTNFHALRHTFATRSLEQGVDVVTLSRLLGHANPSITMDKYGHALDDHKRASVGKLGGLYTGAKKPPSPKRGQER